ncbi:MAG: class II fructose-bisphosphate aldolase [bacterium]
MKTLREYIKDAQDRHVAVGHFNFSNLEGLHAIARAAKKLNVPVIVGTSEGEEDAVGTEEAASLVATIRHGWNIPIFLNADHHYSFERVKKAIDVGYDAVIFDGAALPLDENIAKAKQCVEYARSVSSQTGRDILVEVELGYIGQSSKVLDAIPEGVEMVSNPDDAVSFLQHTGADMLAPAVGNFHGLLRHAQKPRLNIDAIKNIRAKTDAPLVLHGGSGEEADFVAVIDAGIAIIHVNTELRKAYTEALEMHMQKNPDDIAPYKYGAVAEDAMEAVVLQKLKIFNKLQ